MTRHSDGLAVAVAPRSAGVAALHIMVVFCVACALSPPSACAAGWRPASGHTQVPIWPSTAPNGIRGTRYPITRWPRLVETWLQKIGMVEP